MMVSFEVVRGGSTAKTSDLVAGSVCDREEWYCIGELKLQYKMQSWAGKGRKGQGRGRDCCLVEMKKVWVVWVLVGLWCVWVRPLKGLRGLWAAEGGGRRRRVVEYPC